MQNSKNFSAPTKATSGRPAYSGLLGVRSKKLVQRRQRSGCRTSKRMRLEGETRRDMMIGLPPSRATRPDAESLVTEAENHLLTSVNHRLYHVLRYVAFLTCHHETSWFATQPA